MTNASRDENNVPTLICPLNTDGTTIVRVLANPATGGIHISDGTAGTDHGPKNDIRDENNMPAFMAVSSADGFTPVVVYANSSGQLLTQST